MAHITGVDRSQCVLFPVSLDEMIDLDAEVRLIDIFVNHLPLKELGFDTTAAAEGRPGYHPADLFKLYLYGYLNRIRTSRLLERECRRNIELMWLLRGMQPCFRTIAGFRSEHPELFRNTFSYFVKELNAKGFIGGATVAVDGTKFRAVNSKKNNFNQRKIDRQVEYIDTKVNEYLAELDREDISEQRAQVLQEKIEKQQDRKRKYKKIERQLHDSGLDQISTTDPEARSMIIHGSVIEVAYNVQTVADDMHNLIVAYESTSTNDRKALLGMSMQAKAACEVDTLDVLADKGYHNAEQLSACAGENIITYVAQQDVPRKSEIPTADYYGDKFIYDEHKDEYTCPRGHTMKTTGHWYNKKYENHVTKVKHYKTSACKICPVKPLCTANPKGRCIERSEHAKAVEANSSRIKQNRDYYSRRQQIIEHIFGTIKRQWGFDHILLKGIAKNDGEMGLIFLTYNFRRILNLLGKKKTKKWIKSRFLLILTIRQLVMNYRISFKNYFLRCYYAQ